MKAIWLSCWSYVCQQSHRPLTWNIVHCISKWHVWWSGAVSREPAEHDVPRRENTVKISPTWALSICQPSGNILSAGYSEVLKSKPTTNGWEPAARGPNKARVNIKYSRIRFLITQVRTQHRVNTKLHDKQARRE